MLEVFSNLLISNNYSKLLLFIVLIIPGMLWLNYKGYSQSMGEIEVLIFSILVGLIILFCAIFMWLTGFFLITFKFNLIEFIGYLITLLIIFILAVFLFSPSQFGDMIKNNLTCEIINLFIPFITVYFIIVILLFVMIRISNVMIPFFAGPDFSLSIVLLCISIPLIIYFSEMISDIILYKFGLLMIFSPVFALLLSLCYNMLKPFLYVLTEKENYNIKIRYIKSDLHLYSVNNIGKIIILLENHIPEKISNINVTTKWFCNNILEESESTSCSFEKYQFTFKKELNKTFNKSGQWKLQVIVKFDYLNRNYQFDEIRDFTVIHEIRKL